MNESDCLWRWGEMVLTGQNLNKTSMMRYQFKRLDYFVRSTMKSFDIELHQTRVKKFVRSYYEIRHRWMTTRYIPNFDQYSIERQIEIISLLQNRSRLEIQNWDPLTIEEEFRRCARREIAELEKDLLEVFS